MKLTDHTLVLSDQLFDVDTLVVDDAQIREVWLRRKATGRLYAGVRCIDEFCSFGIWSLPKGPYVCLEPWAEDVMMKGFVKIFPESRESTGRSGRMLEKTVCDSDRIEQSILRGVFTTGKKSVRCKNPALFCYLQKKNSRG